MLGSSVPERKVVIEMGEPALAAGWYPDPWQQGELRWHDGAEWTGHVHAAQAQATPVAVAVAVAPEPEPSPEAPLLAWAQESEQPTMQLEAGPLQVEPLGVFAQQAPEVASMAMPSMEETLAGAPERERQSSRRLVLLGVMAVVAIAAVAFVILGRGDETAVPVAPPTTEPAAPVDAAVTEPVVTPTPAPAPDAGGLASAAQLAQEAPGAPARTEPAAPAPAPTGEQIPELAAPAS